MSTDKDYYTLLGIARDASQDEIKKAYRALAKKLHPDVNPEDPGAEDKFKDITAAYNTLSDPEQRKVYDRRYLSVPDFFSMFTDAFSQRMRGEAVVDFNFGFTKNQHTTPHVGAPFALNCIIPISDAIFGSKRKLTLKVMDICLDCQGLGATEFKECENCKGQGFLQVKTGNVIQRGPCRSCKLTGKQPISPCTACQGQAQVERIITEEFDIPKNTRDMTKLRLKGKGGYGARGGSNGDLYITIILQYPNPDNLSAEEIELFKQLCEKQKSTMS